MPNIVQFNSNIVLFNGDQVCFSASASPCGCTDPTTPTPPDPVLNTCASCASEAPCASLLSVGCTPQRLKLAFVDPTFQTSCQTCTGDGKSVRVTAGSIAGDKTLEQDPYDSCRWVFTDAAPSLVVAGFDSNTCTSTETDATEVEYSVLQNADDFTVLVIARFASIKGAEFVMFSVNVPGLFTDSVGVALAGDSSFSFECTDYTERGGGRLGMGGTVTLSLCPDLPDVCTCTNSPDCILLKPVAPLPGGDPDWTYDPTVDGDSIKLPRTNVCEWFTGTTSGFGVTNLQAKVKWYDAMDTHATEGCGYYLYLYAFDGVNAILKGTYFHKGDDAGGLYELFDDVIGGLPRTAVVILDCATPGMAPSTCPGTFLDTVTLGPEWTEVATAGCVTNTYPVWDGKLPLDAVTPCLWIVDGHGLFDLPTTEQFAGASIQLTSDGAGVPCWELQIVQACGGFDTTIWKGRKYDGSTPLGTYFWYDSGLATPVATPVSISVT